MLPPQTLLHLVTHVLHIDSATFPTATVAHVQTFTVTVVVRFTAISIVVAELLLLPLGRRHFSRMPLPPLGAPVLEPDLRRHKNKLWINEGSSHFSVRAIKKFLKSHFALQYFIIKSVTRLFYSSCPVTRPN